MNEYCENILEAIDVCADETLPATKPPGKNNHKHTRRGWNEHVKPFKEEALHWKALWVSAGKPNNHPLFTNIKSSKAQYKYAVRRLKKS